MEAESLHDINEEDEILHKPERATYVFTQYIQDLYRFYKLHPFRNDFRDVFGLSWDITVSELFDILAYAPEVLKSAGQFLFEKEHYPEAIRIFEYLSKLNYPEQEVIEKLAFSYQLMGDSGKPWNTIKKWKYLKQPDVEHKEDHLLPSDAQGNGNSSQMVPRS
jgi:tetratricopeptide (TPR) repeat protein